jgi:esterase/lipase
MNPTTLTGGEHAGLLVYGLQSSPADRLPLAKHLHQAGYTVRLPHIAGTGSYIAIRHTRSRIERIQRKTKPCRAYNPRQHITRSAEL